MNREWGNEQGGRTSKTPTCLLLKPDQSFDSFGYEAVEKYANLQDESEEKRYYFFQHFKMALHNDAVRMANDEYKYRLQMPTEFTLVITKCKLFTEEN